MTQFGRKSANSNRPDSSTDTGLTPHQEKVYGEFFKAIELVGRRLEKTEDERDLLAGRIANLESQVERDDLTGKYYLPAKIGDAGAAPPIQTPKSVIAASVTSVLVALVSLGIVLTQKPTLTQEQIAALQLNPPQFANLEPQSPHWQKLEPSSPAAQAGSTPVAHMTLKSETPAETEIAKASAAATPDPLIQSILDSLEETENARIPEQSVAESQIADASIAPPMDEKETIETISLAEIAPAAGKVESDASVEEATEKSADVAAPEPKIAAAPVAEEKPVLEEAAAVEIKAAPIPDHNSRIAMIEADPMLSGAAKELEKRAMEGVPEAQHDLATLYAAGNAVTLNYERAKYWFERAAEAGIANAHYNLGVMAHQGLGQAVDLKSALIWYKNAAELGHPEALYNLGIAYTEGIGADQDIARGASYFKRAAEAGIAQAGYNLGILHESGFLGGIDMAEAEKWYKMAAMAGHKDAQAAYARVTGKLWQDVEVADVEDIALIEPAAGGAFNEETLIAAIQNYLIANNYLPGQADGVMGPRTEDAIKVYQRENDMDATGLPSIELLSSMQAR